MKQANNDQRETRNPSARDQANFAALLAANVKERAVRKPHTFSQLMDGFNTLLFFWAGQDRTAVLAKLCQHITATDPEVNIDGSFVCNTEDYAGIFLLLRHTHKDFAIRIRKLRALQAALQRFASQRIEGKQIKVMKTAKMAVETLDRPGLLAPIAMLLARRDINLAKLDTERWFHAERDELRCTLMFTMELPENDTDFLEGLRNDIENMAPDFEIAFDDDADAMLENANSFALTERMYPDDATGE